MVSARRAAHPN